MAVVIVSAPPLTNPSSEFSRNPREFLPKRPKLYHSLLRKKKLSRVLAVAQTRIANSSKKQSGLAVKGGVIILPNWNYQRTKEHKLFDAVIYLENMAKKGFKPDLRQATDLVCALCQRNKPGKASRVIEVMGRSGSIPDARSYTFLVNVLCKKGSVGHAMQLVEKMEEYGYTADNVTYNCLLRGLCKRGKLTLSLQFIDRLMQKGLVPDSYTYTVLLQATYIERGVDEAMRCDPDDGTYSAISVLYEEGMGQEAFRIFEILRVKQSRPFNDFYGTAISRFCRKGNMYPAFQLLYDLTMAGFTPNASTYSSLIRGLCAEGMLGAAIEMLRILEANCYRLDIMNFNTLILGLCKCGRTDLSLAIYEEMVEKGYKPNEKTYTIIVEGLAHEEELELAGLVLKELHTREVITTITFQRFYMQYDLEGLST
nr:pentatricopeptide repeat-containing protein At1g79080, chloroplastic-like isoform X2 [Ipomoea trifida]